MASTLQDRTLVVKNFDPEKTTRELLKELFMQAGPVRNVVVRPDHAFVEFADDESVGYSKALLDGVTMFGKKLIMEPKIRMPSHQKYTRILTDTIRHWEQQKALAEQQQIMISQQIMLHQQRAQAPQSYQAPQVYPFQALLVPGPGYYNQVPIDQLSQMPIQPTSSADSQMFSQNHFHVPQTNNQYQQQMASNPGHSGNSDNSARRSRSFNHHYQGHHNDNRYRSSHHRPSNYDRRHRHQR